MKIDEAIDLSRTVLAFGQIYRITKDAQGRPESDTTHTVMLALLAVTVLMDEPTAGASMFLDVLLFALVHDLAETFAGDTPTLRALDADARAAKEAREAEAVEHLRTVMPPWVIRYIERYERQDSDAARFVRYLDKVAPKLTHAGNQGLAVREHGLSLEDLIREHEAQGAKLLAAYPQFPAVTELFREACRVSEDAMKTCDCCDIEVDGRGNLCDACQGDTCPHCNEPTDAEKLDSALREIEKLRGLIPKVEPEWGNREGNVLGRGYIGISDPENPEPRHDAIWVTEDVPEGGDTHLWFVQAPSGFLLMDGEAESVEAAMAAGEAEARRLGVLRG